MLTRESLQERLDWQALDERVDAGWGVLLRARPRVSGSSSIDLLLDESRTWVTQLSFGNWHGHPEDPEDAVDTMRRLVSGERCIVEALDADGKYLKGSCCESGGLPTTLPPNTAMLRRLVFDRAPRTEALDRTRYFVGEARLVLLEHRAQVEQLYGESGLPPPEW